jgi:hypothetical protein
MKVRSSTKIAIGFVIIAGGLIYGYKFAMRQAIMSQYFPPVVPGNVNIVGINTGAGFKIIVANQMAQLVQASDSFHGVESDSGGATEGAIKKRVPIREMLQVLQGNLKALGTFIMKVNERDENDTWPPVRVVWPAERLMKALDGDKVEEAKLVHDLNINLDGTPLPILDRDSMENGIIIDYPVSVTVNSGGVKRTLVGRVQEPFKPDLLTTIERKLTDKLVNNDMIAGYYAEESQKVLSGASRRQDIRKSIMARLAPSNAKELSEAPERILASAEVVVNDSHIESASYRNYDTTNGKMNDLTIEMTEEGRKRLWKFSEDRVGTQLMLIVNGVAIAAPRISHELAQGEITITQLADETLVKEAVAALNHHDVKPKAAVSAPSKKTG